MFRVVSEAGGCVESPHNAVYWNVVSWKNPCASERAQIVNFFSHEFQKYSSKKGGNNSETKRTEEEFEISKVDKCFLGLCCTNYYFVFVSHKCLHSSTIWYSSTCILVTLGIYTKKRSLLQTDFTLIK
jgi:hypothetical protein